MTALLFLALCAAVAAATPLEAPPQEFSNILKNSLNDNVYVPDSEIHPDGHLTTGELIEKYGYDGETHHVTTEDGYILEIHRVAGSKSSPPKKGKQVVLILHGLLADSTNFVVSGPDNALAYVMADAGYDVWLGNVRGNNYGRNHVKLTTKDKAFWDFSFHEMGTTDLPAMIDYILKETEEEKLLYIGHSQGGTIFLVMASERPEYQDKVEAMFGLAPASYCGRMPSLLLQILARFNGKIHLIANLIGEYEFGATPKAIKDLGAALCDPDMITSPLCSNIYFLLGGYSNQLNTSLLPILVEQMPSSASVKQFVHFSQLVNSWKFRQYDYGLFKNLKVYGRITPPSYNLAGNKVPTYIHYSTNDQMVNVRDVHQLYKELGNAIAKFRVPDPQFNHIDFLFGLDVKRFVYDKILSLMTYHKH